jgi:hypothetical protein
MTQNDHVDPLESRRLDPLLRLDQLIHRQDETVGCLKSLIKLNRILALQLGLLTLLNVILLIWLIWK